MMRKWDRRWEDEGWEGLWDKSRARKKPRRRITPQQCQEAIKLKEELPSWSEALINRYHRKNYSLVNQNFAMKTN